MTLRISGKTRFSGQSSIKQGYSRYYVEGDTRYEPKTVADFAGLYSSNEYYRTSGNMTTFSDMFTHVRDSNATMVDSDGLLKWAPHNLLTYSEEFNNAAWAYVSPSSTVSANAIASPNGALTADEITFTGAGNDWRYHSGISAPAGSKFKVWLRLASGSGSVALRTWDTGQFSVANLTSEWQLFTLDIVSAEGTALGLDNRSPYTGDGSSKTVYAWGAHVYRSDLGGMVNNPDRNDSYVPTTSSPVYLPRRNHYGWNGSSYVNKGLLLETEARTNLIQYSEDVSSWSLISGTTETPDQATAPSGQLTADLVAETVDTVAHIAADTVSFTSGLTYTQSIFLKKGSGATAPDILQLTFGSAAFGSSQYANYNISTGQVLTSTGGTALIEAFDNGWYRCVFTATATTTASTTSGLIFTNNNDALGRVPQYTGATTSDVFVYGFQLEAGSTPSSYIPTTGASDTRALETLTIPAAKMAWPTPNVIGPELVTNGTFDTDLTGWSVGGSDGASITWNSGQADIVGNAYIAQQLTGLTAGAVYQIKASVTETNSQGSIRIGTSQNVGDLYDSPTFLSAVDYDLYIVPSGTGLWITLKNEGAIGDAAAYSFWDNISIKEIDPLSVSLQMQGEMTYADTGVDLEDQPFRWHIDTSNRIDARLTTTGSITGQINFRQSYSGTTYTVSSGIGAYSPDVNVPFNIASRHGSTFINGAVDGTALTANTTLTELPDLSATNFNLGYDYMGTIALFREDNNDWTDSGISMATSKPYNIILPVISGGIFVGTVLSVSDGEWADSPTITYQWLRNGSSIFGATTNTYTLRYGDLGSNISCRVTATLNGRSTVVITNSIGPIEFTPSILFASGEDGAWYDPSDTTSLYQSRTGGDYADADGDVVGIMLDKSQMGGSTAAAFIAGQPELVTNGTFDADSDWTKGGSTTISSGVVNFTTSGDEIYQQPGFDETKYYAVTFTVVGSGSLYFRLGAIVTNVEQVTASGTYTFIVKPTSSDGYIVFRSFGFTGTLDNVTVKEIPGNHAVAPTDDARPLYKTDGTYHWIESDGVDDYMTATYSATFTSPFTRSAAYQANVYGDFILDGIEANDSSFYQTSSTEIRFYAGGTPDCIASGYPIGYPAYLFGEVTGGVGAGNLSISGSGGSDTGTNNGGYPSGITIMASGINTLHLDGRIYGIVDIDRLLTTTERSALEAYFAAKSGVTL